MLELPALRDQFEATRARKRTAHLLTRTVGPPCANDAVRIVEVENGQRTGRAEYALVTHVEEVPSPLGAMFNVNFEIRGMSSDSMRALRNTPTPVPTG